MIKKGMAVGILLGITAWAAQALEHEIALELGYASRYVAEGMDAAPDADGVFFSELALEIESFTLGGVFVQGINNSYNEVNVYLEYGLEWEQAAAYAGVQFLTYPAGDEDPDSWEAFIGGELDLLGLATLYGEYFYDFDDLDGGFIEVGIETEIPQPVADLSIAPYVQLGVDAGFVSGTRKLKENNVDVGVNAAYALTDAVDLFGGIHHSFALTNLDREDEGDVSWGEIGIGLTF